jgi:hypothetical protein
LYTNITDAKAAMGESIENNLGMRSDVSSTKSRNGKPLFVTISTNLNDCVSHNIDKSENATKKNPTQI